MWCECQCRGALLLLPVLVLTLSWTPNGAFAVPQGGKAVTPAAGAVSPVPASEGAAAGPARPPAGPDSGSGVSGLIDSLGSWFSGVSGQLYEAVQSGLGDSIDLATVSDRVTGLLPNIEYAPFSVINANKEAGYEIRHYPSQKWACTEEPVVVDPVESETVQWNRTKIMFDRLFQYFAGENSRDEKLQMTLPITNRFEAYSESPSYSMCLYIPHAMQTSPPTPEHPRIEVVQWPPKTFVVRQFTGYVMYRRGWDRAAFKLEKLTRENSLPGVDYSKYYSVNYDFLVKFWNRKNEVWFELSG